MELRHLKLIYPQRRYVHEYMNKYCTQNPAYTKDAFFFFIIINKTWRRTFSVYGICIIYAHSYYLWLVSTLVRLVAALTWTRKLDTFVTILLRGWAFKVITVRRSLTSAGQTQFASWPSDACVSVVGQSLGNVREALRSVSPKLQYILQDPSLLKEVVWVDSL